MIFIDNILDDVPILETIDVGIHRYRSYLVYVATCLLNIHLLFVIG